MGLFHRKSVSNLEHLIGTSLLALFIFVHRNKNEPKNARPAKLAPLRQYRGRPPAQHNMVRVINQSQKFRETSVKDVTGSSPKRMIEEKGSSPTT